jgi:CARDB protein
MKALLNVNWRVMTAILAAITLGLSAFSSMTFVKAYGEDDDKQNDNKKNENKHDDHDDEQNDNKHDDDDEEDDCTSEGRSSAKLKALPKKSLVDDGNSQLLELKMKLRGGDILKQIEVTVDGESVVVFKADGTIVSSGPAFENVFGQVQVSSDGYCIEEGKGKFVIAMDKEALGEGDHAAVAKVVLDANTLTATDNFTLKASEPVLPDLVAKIFYAPSTMKKPLKYMTFTIESNEGSTKANAHMVNVYLSEDNAIDSSDIVIGDKHAEKLKAGWFNLIPVQIKLPQDTVEGDYNLIVKVDATDSIEEISETNNELSRTTEVTSH